MRATVAILLGVMGSAVLHAAAAPPPVLRSLGEIQPTPEPTPAEYQKKRLITTITVQNTPQGDTMVMFEATDVGDKGDGKFGILASERYTLTEVNPKALALKEGIITRIRELENQILDFVEVAGPPKERAPLAPGKERPYK